MRQGLQAFRCYKCPGCINLYVKQQAERTAIECDKALRSYTFTGTFAEEPAENPKKKRLEAQQFIRKLRDRGGVAYTHEEYSTYEHKYGYRFDRNEHVTPSGHEPGDPDLAYIGRYEHGGKHGRLHLHLLLHVHDPIRCSPGLILASWPHGHVQLTTVQPDMVYGVKGLAQYISKYNAKANKVFDTTTDTVLARSGRYRRLNSRNYGTPRLIKQTFFEEDHHTPVPECTCVHCAAFYVTGAKSAIFGVEPLEVSEEMPF